MKTVLLCGVRVVHVVKLHVFAFLIPCCEVRYDFRVKMMFDLSWLPVLQEVHVLFMLFVFIYVYWCSTRSPYQMMFVSFNSNTRVTSGAGTGTLPEHLSSPPVFSGVPVARSLVFYKMFCRSMFVLLFCFCWSLCYLYFFDLRLLITPFGIFSILR